MMVPPGLKGDFIMKSKKLSKKLSFNKQTVSHLQDSAMEGIRGGVYSLQWTCGRACDSNQTCGDLTWCDDCYTNGGPFCH